ncbi:hypothetical protein PV05_00718 [Exophiala xenobiotica]|uniref:Uncharacterized protein n=1 Tax=Exophiala xenobiotica TaxID=348802 RepID=A0A0D2FK67_9EURO|nr:uncharacterized protein PV05_00718 [Exophiala xenobiotica]KIW60504.1 hypothetical protein PV05_00718 [Exophiala xenobiotica]
MECPTSELQKTNYPANDVTASNSSSESRLKSSYIQTRLDRSKKRQDDLNQKMAEAKQKEGNSRRQIEELRNKQEQVKSRHSGEETAFENARKEFEAARARLNSKEDALQRVQDEIENYAKSIKEEEKSVADSQANQGRIDHEIRELHAMQGRAARQAEVLDLRAFEISALVEHAHSNKGFLAKLNRIAQGTATETMYKDLQSELWAKSTGASKEELTNLVATELLPKIDQKATVDKDPQTTAKVDAHNRAGRKRKTVVANLQSLSQSETDSDGYYLEDSDEELVDSRRGRRAQLFQRAQKDKAERDFRYSKRAKHQPYYTEPVVLEIDTGALNAFEELPGKSNMTG